MWILIHTGNIRVAIADVYLACINNNKPEYVRQNQVLLEMISRERTELSSLGYKCIVMGDCNARVGHLGILGERGNDNKINKNGKLLKNFATDNHMVILNSRPICEGKRTDQVIVQYGVIGSQINTKQ